LSPSLMNESTASFKVVRLSLLDLSLLTSAALASSGVKPVQNIKKPFFHNAAWVIISITALISP
jgi:hypothetical protein